MFPVGKSLLMLAAAWLRHGGWHWLEHTSLHGRERLEETSEAA